MENEKKLRECFLMVKKRFILIKILFLKSLPIDEEKKNHSCKAVLAILSVSGHITISSFNRMYMQVLKYHSFK